jgi:hypothetical protein
LSKSSLSEVSTWNAPKGEVGERSLKEPEISAKLVLDDIRFGMGEAVLMILDAYSGAVGL